MARIGYARVSTEEQNLALQRDALEEAGCAPVFEDHGLSAVSTSRPGFMQALAALEPGDTLVIWKMDRAFRSLKHALDSLEILEKKGVEFRSITDHIDTSTPTGRCMYQVRNAFAELERNLISERTKAGLAAARRRGVKLGRPRKLSGKEISAARTKLSRERTLTRRELACELGVSEKTLRRAIRDAA